MKQNLRFLAVLSKATLKPTIKPNWMGIYVNSSKIAVSIIGKGNVLKQTYYGQDVSTRQFMFEKRRAKLQKLRDAVSRGRAGLKLKKLSGKQKNYVRTGMWMISNEIVKLAKRFNANIAIEGLKHLRKRNGEWSKRSIRKVNHIPYGFFRHALNHVAERDRVASLNIAKRATLVADPTKGQFPLGNAPVSGQVLKDERCGR
jgi:IS605 OrfB family transposase